MLGGFFITVFKKTNPLSYGSEKIRRPEKIVNADKGVYFLEDHPNIISSIQNYYGLNNFPFEQLVTHSKIQKRINFVSKGVFQLLKSDSRNQIKIMAVGVKLFSINKKTVDSIGQEQCLYRVCQDGLSYVIPFMRKRVYFCGRRLFTDLIKAVDIKHTDFGEDNEDLKNLLQNISTGCVVLILLKNTEKEIKYTHEQIFNMTYEEYLAFLKENYQDALCCYNSPIRISTMINKEHQHVFNLKYNLEA